MCDGRSKLKHPRNSLLSHRTSCSWLRHSSVISANNRPHKMHRTRKATRLKVYFRIYPSYVRKPIETGSCQLIFYLSVIGMSFWTWSFSLRPPMVLFVYHMTCSLNAFFLQGSLEQALAMQNLSDQRNAALLLISTLFL